MVFALETFWPATDGWSAARIEEQLVVTADGCEVITRFPAEDLVIAGKPYFTAGGSLPLERDPQSNLNTELDADAQEAVPGNGRCPSPATPAPLAVARSHRSRPWAAPPALADVPEPRRGPGEALVRIRAACSQPGRAAHLNGAASSTARRGCRT